jgi:ribonuclease VapC
VTKKLKGPCVLDASALLAWMHGEPGGELVEDVLGTSLICSVNFSEVVQKTIEQDVPSEGLMDDLEGVGCEVVPFEAKDAIVAGELWAKTKSKGLSLGDRACLALAVRARRPVVTADRAWTTLKLPVEVWSIR